MNKVYTQYVAAVLSERELLEQLAEEASELSQAALKLIRAAKYSDNVTPVEEEEAVARLVEEHDDVLITWNVVKKALQKVDIEEYRQDLYRRQAKKLERWAKRLGYEGC